MRVLIIAAVFACAAAAPSGLLAAPYSHGIGLGYSGFALGHGASLGYAAPWAVGHAALPTISHGDIAGASIDAHVDANDHARAAVDAAREYHDQASELHGQAVNAAEDHSWQAIDAVKTREAQIDGARAGVSPILAKQIVGHAAPVAAYAGYGAGLATGYAAGGLVASYGAGYGADYGLASSKTIATQSLIQSHPAPWVHAAPYAAIGHASLGYAHGLQGHAW